MTATDLVLQFGPFRLLPQPRMLLKGGEPVRLGSRAREILLLLVERAGRIVKKAELIKRVWPDTVVEEGTLRVHIAALRKALDDGKGEMRYIENVTGHGYRFVAPLTSADHPGSSLQEQRFITVAGTGGIGKTSLAMATAYQLQLSYEDGVCFVDLGSLLRCCRCADCHRK
jgi:DNA-binding winged helix-turn-helix (wHTH) protein